MRSAKCNVDFSGLAYDRFYIVNVTCARSARLSSKQRFIMEFSPSRFILYVI